MELQQLLHKNHCSLSCKITRFDGSRPVGSWETEAFFFDNESIPLLMEGASWNISSKATPIDEGIVDLKLQFCLLSGECEQMNASIDLQFDDWNKDHYVLMPAAAYNGNRFESRKMPYPPQLDAPEDLGVDVPTLITDIPRLNIHHGISKIQQLAGDMATPAIGFFNKEEQQGFWLLTHQNTHLGETGMAIEENSDRSKAGITVSAPGIRHVYSYKMCDSEHPSPDRGASFKAGDSVELHIRLYFFQCRAIQGLFDYFKTIRKELTGEVALKHQLPFSGAWSIQEDKYNNESWVEEWGYYSPKLMDDEGFVWLIGWVGGLMVTHPLLFEGSDLSRQRALRNFDFVFNGGQDRSGLFHGGGLNGKWYGDNFSDPHKKWHLIRKSSDALYFIFKQFMLLEKMEARWAAPAKWADGVRKCVDAFVTLWKRYGQFGQFLNSETGDIIIGGSACGGMIPAGLVLAWRYFGIETYLEVAKQSARYFYDNFIVKGYTTGGPGEICQCPDSESAFALLESYVVLYEETHDTIWLDMAKDTANQCMTWCVSYDFQFPPDTAFGQLDMRTAGSVYANVQNKHSAPAICTLSGDSLLKLYRATGDRQYLELLQELAHNLPQYLSREDRPIRACDGRSMPAGWMNERVEMCDWLEPVGEVFYESCWCEVSNMLTYVEVPGLYVQTDTAFVCAIDHIDVEMLGRSEVGKVRLKVSNPTGFEAKVKILAESSEDMKNALGQNALWGCPIVVLAPGENKELEF